MEFAWKLQAQNMGRTWTEHVLPMFCACGFHGNSMNNLLSYCGLNWCKNKIYPYQVPEQLSIPLNITLPIRIVLSKCKLSHEEFHMSSNWFMTHLWVFLAIFFVSQIKVQTIRNDHWFCFTASTIKISQLDLSFSDLAVVSLNNSLTYCLMVWCISRKVQIL